MALTQNYQQTFTPQLTPFFWPPSQIIKTFSKAITFLASLTPTPYPPASLANAHLTRLLNKDDATESMTLSKRCRHLFLHLPERELKSS